MKPAILVVDDDIAVCTLLQDVLSEHVFTVTACHTGQEALRCIETQPDIALVLLDMMLPDINGLMVLQQVQKMRPGLPVVMLTGLGSESDVVVGLEMGADDYLTKPFVPRELFARMGKLIAAWSSPPATVTVFGSAARGDRHLARHTRYHVATEGREERLRNRRGARSPRRGEHPDRTLGRKGQPRIENPRSRRRRDDAWPWRWPPPPPPSACRRAACSPPRMPARCACWTPTAHSSAIPTGTTATSRWCWWRTMAAVLTTDTSIEERPRSSARTREMRSR